MSKSISLATLILALVALSLSSQGATKGPQVSNYGYMQSTDRAGRAVALPLKHTDVKADIAGFVASVRVTQEFHNPFDTPIEAIYVFPLPHKAAVNGLTMRLGDRVIKGVIKERQEARRIYDDAKRTGKTAALLDQERPNVFTQSVANILPGDDISVELTYVEILSYEAGSYKFVFPMVVGPRYVSGGHTPDAARITPRLLAKGLRPGHDISLKVNIEGGLEMRDLKCKSHWTGVKRKGSRAVVRLSPKDSIPNKDFILRYSLAGPAPDVASLTYNGRLGGTFLMMIQPQDRMTAADIAPREYIFVVDTSGSMSGFPLQKAKAVMRLCLEGMGPQDRFNVINFAGAARSFAPRAVAATPRRIKEALRSVAAWRGGGGTEFFPALRMVVEAPKDPGRSRVILFMTDGYIGYENQVLAYLRQNLKDSNLFALGIGTSVNRFLIDGMARIGLGEPFYLRPDQGADGVVQRFFRTASQPGLTNVEVDWGSLEVEELTPNILPDLFAERPLFVVGRYTSPGESKVRVTGKLAGRPFLREIDLVLPREAREGNEALPYLWARRQMEDLMDIYRTMPDRREDARKVVTELALRFNLMSEFTSFVAVDEAVRNETGRQVTRNVPVVLPEMVSPKAAPSQAYMGGGPIKKGYRRKAAQAPPKGDVGGDRLEDPFQSGAASPRARGGYDSLRENKAPAAQRTPSTMSRPARPQDEEDGNAYGGLAGKDRPAGRTMAPPMAPPPAEPSPMAMAEPLAESREAEQSRSEAAPMAKARTDRSSITRASVTVEPSSLKVAGVSQEDMLRQIEAKLAGLRALYQGVLAKGPVSGKVMLRLRIGADGRVIKASLIRSTVADPTLGKDVARKAQGWSFSLSQEAIVTVTLVFGQS